MVFVVFVVFVVVISQEMKYDDGDSPPGEIIDRWLAVVDDVFIKRKPAPDQQPPAIAVHCVAGQSVSQSVSS